MNTLMVTWFKQRITLFFFLALFFQFYYSPAYAEKTYNYISVPNDPMKARIYTLDNGLTVYMSVYKNAPRIQTYIAVKAGSKTDPPDATGLAHYLEHMLFKGTDKYGTKDYAKEKPLLDEVENLYETYRGTRDSLQRKSIYHQIDSVSGVAATFAIANEYDKLTNSIGAKGTNAYTWVEQTVYVNDIPSNQLEKFITIEAERFRNPVLRIFHTELEAVYEEKNRTLDNDGDKLYDALFAGLWQKHTYGTQTTIGTIDHLKNPSIKKIKEYLNKYYVPNNMAICLAGDFDPDKTIKIIDEKFGVFKNKPFQPFVPPVEQPINSPVVKNVYGPDAETMNLAFRFGGAATSDADMLTLVDKLLYNGTAGLLDLNLNQSQKVLNSNSSIIILKDYSAHVLSADPREGQSLEEVRDLLLSQIDLLKKGDFPDWLLSAVITDMKLQETQSLTSNRARANAFVESAVLGVDWKDAVGQLSRLSKITKKQIVDFVNKNYSNNYVIVYKHTGVDSTVQKVSKPEITPVTTNRDEESPFVQNIIATKVEDIKPVFLDYKNDIKHFNVKNAIQVNYKKNEENNLFDLTYIFDMGTNNDKKIDVTVNYLQYLGTSKLTPAQVKQEFYKLGCSFNVFSSENQTYVSLGGLSENFSPAVALFENLLNDAQPNKDALGNLISDILKKRADAKLSKDQILWSGMASYAKYGAKSPFTDNLTEKQLQALTPDELVSEIKNIDTYEHRILYFGPEETTTIQTALNTLHIVPATLQHIPAPTAFTEQSTSTNKVYVVNYDMKQAEILLFSKGNTFDKTILPSARAYNEYMSSVVFQDLRESKALAYSVFSGYQMPAEKDKSAWNVAYIGAQADKLPEAMKGMLAILTDMPEIGKTFDAAKEAVIQKISTERITNNGVLMNYENAKKLGLDYDVRKDVYDNLQTMSMNDVVSFQKQYVKNDKYTIVVLGDKDKLDIDVLKKYGEVKFLSLEDIFGY